MQLILALNALSAPRTTYHTPPRAAGRHHPLTHFEAGRVDPPTPVITNPFRTPRLRTHIPHAHKPQDLIPPFAYWLAPRSWGKWEGKDSPVGGAADPAPISAFPSLLGPSAVSWHLHHADSLKKLGPSGSPQELLSPTSRFPRRHSSRRHSVIPLDVLSDSRQRINPVKYNHEAKMALLRSVLGSLVGVSFCSQLAAGYAVGNPAALARFQHVFPNPGRVVAQAPIFRPEEQQQPRGPLVPNGLDDWIQEQRNTSMRFLLDNIAPFGSNARGAAPGSVIASPSKHAPNYYYQWVRDAAITMAEVVAEYGETKDEGLKTIVEQYAKLQDSIQNTFNPSGGYTTGGLGEPKFMVDGAPFTGFVSSVVLFVQFTHAAVADRFGVA